MSASDTTRDDLLEIMEHDRERYMRAAEGGMLYGRRIADMGREELMLTIGFLIEDWPRMGQYPVTR